VFAINKPDSEYIFNTKMFFHKSGLASPLRLPSGSNHDHCLIPAVDVTENQMMKMLFVGILDQKFSKIN
jgi:hypothetical protein